MAIDAGIFGNNTNFESRYVPDHDKLTELVAYWKNLGLKIVLTSGTWDLFHMGHAQYLEKAKALGDLLIIGVDSDEKVKARKGPNRPVVPEMERISIISHIRHTDVITLKNIEDPKNHLIKLIRPHTLVVSKSTKHKEEILRDKREYCDEIVMIEPQSETSTSARLRLMHIRSTDQFARDLIPEMSELIERKLREQ